MTRPDHDARLRALHLDDRDIKLLALVARGRRNSEIAREFSCTERRVQTELAALCRKLEVDGRVGLAGVYLGEPAAPVRTVLCFGGEELELR